jgi:preprotein translocase subunit SecE
VANKKADGNNPESGGLENKSNFNPAGFLQESKDELAKVVWPSRQQLISESLAVIGMVAISATIIYFVNNFFGWIAGEIFK